MCDKLVHAGAHRFHQHRFYNRKQQIKWVSNEKRGSEKRYCEECVSGERRPEERTEGMYLQDEMYPGEYGWIDQSSV